ncbi:MAG: hypothetical protein RDU13_11865 [Elusimicrobiales bacterium]|nr:hypothetical protein [Elusimicrobiales bacterium]
MVIRPEVFRGFSQDISNPQTTLLLDRLSSLCGKGEYILFVSNLPRDLEKKVFVNLAYYPFSGWQFGPLAIDKRKNLKLVKNLWSSSYGTPLYFIITSRHTATSFEKVKEVIIRLERNLSGIATYFTYNSPAKTEAPILLSYFNKVAMMGHDGETLEIYNAPAGPADE